MLSIALVTFLVISLVSGLPTHPIIVRTERRQINRIVLVTAAAPVGTAVIELMVPMYRGNIIS